jgi:small subunit ribosomal protein S1
MNQGDIVRAEVTGVRDNGVFLHCEGLDGFVNVTNISWEQGRLDHRNLFRKGELIDVLVYAITENRFYASIKDVYPEANPWRDPGIYAVGTRHIGILRSVVPFGAFVELGVGAVGLLPDAKTLVEGDQIEVLVVNVDDASKKILLRRASD